VILPSRYEAIAPPVTAGMMAFSQPYPLGNAASAPQTIRSVWITAAGDTCDGMVPLIRMLLQVRF